MKMKDHMDITSFAVDLYWLFSPTDLADAFKENIADIKEGAGLVKKESLQRNTHTLHFFNHKNRFEPNKIKLLGLSPTLTLYPTSEHSLRKYIQELGQNLAEGLSKNSYHLVGKIMHLVQDMSSPPNVIPVYHTADGSDSFETRLNYKLGSFLSGFNYNQERFNLVSECSAGENCIENVYQGAALTTLEHINSSKSKFDIEIDGKTKKAGWELFWDGDEQVRSSPSRYRLHRIKGFGRYGPLGKHFGQEQVKVARQRYVVNSSIYDELCGFVIRKSIEDSLKILICIEKQLERLH